MCLTKLLKIKHEEYDHYHIHTHNLYKHDKCLVLLHAISSSADIFKINLFKNSGIKEVNGTNNQQRLGWLFIKKIYMFREPPDTFVRIKNNKISAPENKKKKVIFLSRDLIVTVFKNRCIKLADITFKIVVR